MISEPEDARLGLLAAYALDMFPGAGSRILEPPPDPRLSPDWTLRGYLTACDALMSRRMALGFGGRAFYGFLAESAVRPGTFAVAIRGTADIVEWAIDAKFVQRSHPAGGSVESGFYGLFQSMRYRPPGGPDEDVGPGIAKAVGKGALTVIGHSLGAPLATFVALDLARNYGPTPRARLFASPRPGDQAFADAFAVHVPDAVGYAYERDEVPEVPFGFGYLPLHCQRLITVQDSQAVIRDNPAAAHHLYCYLAALDYGLTRLWSVPARDQSVIECILGPNPHFLPP